MSRSFGYAIPLGGTAPSSGVVRWPLATRSPLPPPPVLMDHQPPDPQSQCWSKETYDSTIPFTPPDHPDPLFVRGNFSLLVPGFTGGYNDKDRRLLMEWDLPMHSESDQNLCLDYIASIHSHVLYSRPHGLNNEMTLDQLTESMLRAKARKLKIILNAVSDGFSYTDAIPWFDHLLGKGALIPKEDSSCFCWQVDRYYDPPRLCDELIIQSDYCKRVGLYRWVHWLNGACAWWTPEDEHDPNGSCERYGVCDRFSFQTWADAYLDGHLNQLDHNAELDQLQSNNAKILQSLVPTHIRLCYAEGSAQGLYDAPSDQMALYGRQKGYYIMCARYQGRFTDGGYLNDAGLPDGRPL